MAHGSKRWIVCFDGHVKKSKDRTKKDYYRGLKQWEPYGGAQRNKYHISRPKKNYTGEYCPQCKHNYKAIKAYNDVVWDEVEKLQAQWDKMHQKEIDVHDRALEKYRAWEKKYGWKYEAWTKQYGWKNYNPIIVPPDPRWQHGEGSRWEYVRKNRTKEHAIYHEETYLCPKHRHAFDVQWSMWHEKLPGRKAHYQYTVRQDYKNYRYAVKNVLQRAKYDEEYYDDIPAYKPCWLD